MPKFTSVTHGDSSVAGSTLMALLLINLLSLLYAANVFIQFPLTTVLEVFGAFQFLLILLGIVFLRPKLVFPLELSPRVLITAIFLVLFFVYLFASQGHSNLPVYVKTFPTLEAQMGLLWHQDTAFHVSLIQSILNFGYPSIAQHGHPLTAYHVLSHYVDALIIWITGIDPFESYGLFSHFKVVLFLSAALLMIGRFCRGQGLVVLLLSVGLFLPALVGTWRGVLSHGLWIPSLLLLLSAPFVVSTLYRDELPTWPKLFTLAGLVVLIALGKVSSGFMFACFVGFWIFCKAPFSLRTLLFGIATLSFFYGYGQLFISQLNQINSTISISGIELGSLFSYYSSPDVIRDGRQVPSLAGQLLLLWGLLSTICLLQPRRRNFQVLFAATLSLLCLWLVCETNPALSVSDIIYFQYGLAFVLLLVGYALVLAYWAQLRDTLAGNANRIIKWMATATALFAAVLFAPALTRSGYGAFNLSQASVIATYEYLQTGAFARLNKRLPEEQRFNLLQPYASKRGRMLRLQQSSYLWGFKRYMQWYLREKSVKPSQAALFIPDTVFNGELARLRGMPWANGLLVYAVLGIPLVHGATEVARGYGFPSYPPSARRKSLEAFTLEEACRASGAQVIWVVARLNTPSAAPMNCPLSLAK